MIELMVDLLICLSRMVSMVLVLWRVGPTPENGYVI